jgi:hypothetical membrane protein
MTGPSILDQRQLGTLAAAGIAFWPVVVIGLHIYRAASYDPLRLAISELALGPGGFLLNIAFVVLGLGCLALAQGLRNAVRGAVTGPVLLRIAALLAIVSAVFHTNAHGTPATLTSQIHDNAGLVSFVLIVAAMYTFAWRFMRDDSWRSFSRPTLIWAAVSSAAFFLVPGLGDNLFGLAQRIFIVTWMSWMLVAAMRLRTTAVRSPEWVAGHTVPPRASSVNSSLQTSGQ